MQALILAGGEGTRLRPLTSTIPKPVVPLAGQPFIAHMLEWLRAHGVEDVILSCGFMAADVREVLGDGRALGLSLRYLEEPEPLGTGGALRFAQELLAERFLMLNGDILTDIDLTAQLAAHERSGARATLALIAVEDPSAYGLVRCNQDLTVRQFLEKPSPEEIDTDLINAGCYVLEREVLDAMPPAGSNFSIERDVFPALVGRGLYGFPTDGYWLDIGTPERYLQGTFDILEGTVSTVVGRRLEEAGRALLDGAQVAGEVHPPVILDAGCAIAAQALVGARAVLGAGVLIDAGARVSDSVVLEHARVGAATRVCGSIVGPQVKIGAHCLIEDGVVIGAGAQIGDRNVLRAGMRVFPQVRLPEGAIRF
jgi:mannose-1-phosphate guanylyltransferase